MLNWERNDGGRADSGRRGGSRAKDCAVRALAIVADLPYDAVLDMVMEEQGYSPDKRGTDKKAFRRILKALGFIKVPQGRVKMTYSEVAERFPAAIVSTTRHVCAILDGALHDTFDGRTYTYDNGFYVQVRERKARSVWVLEGTKELETQQKGKAFDWEEDMKDVTWHPSEEWTR